MNDSDTIAEEAIKLATKWHNRADKVKHFHEEARHKRLARLFANPKDKVILTRLIDQSFRSADNRRGADQIHHLIIPLQSSKNVSPNSFDILRFDSAEPFDPELTAEGLVAGCGSLFKAAFQQAATG